MRSFASKVAAEAVGTFAMVFAGCGAMMVNELFSGSLSGSAVPAVFGLTVTTMVYTVGHISGAHFNPAVTLAFAVSRHFPKREMLGYWLAQFSGAIAAIFLLSVLLPAGTVYGATIATVSPLQALAWEMILSFFLMFVIIAVATDTRATGTMAGVAIGATVTFCAMVGGPVTGAAMNPARALAPALFQGHVSQLWIYFFGPSVGATLAALLYEKIRCESDKKSAKGCC